jgi:molecular chaperone Hsp33
VSQNYVQRFIFDQLDIRGRLVVLSDSWRSMLAGRDYPEHIARLLGDTVAVGVLVGAQRKGEHRVTTQVRGNGPVSLLVAECGTGLKIRGMATTSDVANSKPDGTLRELLGDGRLVLTVDDAQSGQRYQSLIPLEGETLTEAFEQYFSQSEQIPSFLRLYSSSEALCGLLLEKLPNADARDPDGWNRATILANTLRLEETLTLSASSLLVRLFPEELLRVFPLEHVQYHCPHDRERVKNMLRSLGRSEVESILAEQGEVRINDEMCNQEYLFQAGDITELFAQSS